MNDNEKVVLRAVLDMLMYLPEVPMKWKQETLQLGIDAGLFPDIKEQSK